MTSTIRSLSFGKRNDREPFAALKRRFPQLTDEEIKKAVVASGGSTGAATAKMLSSELWARQNGVEGPLGRANTFSQQAMASFSPAVKRSVSKKRAEAETNVQKAAAQKEATAKAAAEADELQIAQILERAKQMEVQRAKDMEAINAAAKAAAARVAGVEASVYVDRKASAGQVTIDDVAASEAGTVDETLPEEPGLQSVGTEIDDTPEELMRRREWIRYYVEEGDLHRAFDLGWDGKAFRLSFDAKILRRARAERTKAAHGAELMPWPASTTPATDAAPASDSKGGVEVTPEGEVLHWLDDKARVADDTVPSADVNEIVEVSSEGDKMYFV